MIHWLNENYPAPVSGKNKIRRNHECFFWSTKKLRRKTVKWSRLHDLYCTYWNKPKSSMSHHFKVLRDSGVIQTTVVGKEHYNSLRKEDLKARFPGLLETLLLQIRDLDEWCVDLHSKIDDTKELILWQCTRLWVLYSPKLIRIYSTMVTIIRCGNMISMRFKDVFSGNNSRNLQYQKENKAWLYYMNKR